MVKASELQKTNNLIKNNELFSMFLNDGELYNILPELLKDRTTDKNIVWATDMYENYGVFYHRERQMFPDFNINLIFNGTLLPRNQKTKEQQQFRTKSKAEVFTPSWICNRMNNFCDEQWFMRKNVFNVEVDDGDAHTWTTIPDKIKFDDIEGKKQKEWQRYVDSRRIEITCGEAPYLVSRYDTTTGEQIPVCERIGVLDRKLRIVNENTDNEKDWYKWAVRAFEATYGFEYQGDNLFFARINMIQTFIDYYSVRFGKKPTKAKLKKIATIVSWNLWQMDGLLDIAPFGIPEDGFKKADFTSKKKKNKKNEPVYCIIKDWRNNKVIEYRSMKGNK